MNKKASLLSSRIPSKFSQDPFKKTNYIQDSKLLMNGGPIQQ